MILVIDYVSNQPIDCFWQVLTDKKWLYGNNDNMRMMIHSLREMWGAQMH